MPSCVPPGSRWAWCVVLALSRCTGHKAAGWAGPQGACAAQVPSRYTGSHSPHPLHSNLGGQRGADLHSPLCHPPTSAASPSDLGLDWDDSRVLEADTGELWVG